MKNVVFFTFLALFIFSCDDDNDGGGGIPAGAPVLSTTDLEVAEGEENKTLTVRFGFTEPVDREFIVNYLLRGATATVDTDFVRKDGSIVFAAGDQQREIEITILGDFVAEDDEAFSVRLSSPTSEFAEAIINITILDNGGGGVSNLVIPNGTTSPESYPGYTLVWEDDFTESVLNSSDWNFEIGNGCPNLCGWGNNELEFYTDDNLFFKDDDYLIIQARPETIGTNEFTSARITTQGKQNFKYGRIDIRAVLPEGQGIWPAIWMLGEDITTVGWPACGEIDIMELIGNQPRTTHATFHYGRDFDNHQFRGDGLSLPADEKFSDEFHVFSLIWEEDTVQVLMDEQLVFEIEPSITNPQPYPFNDDFFFIMNVAVGGNWPGNPDATTTFPQHMIVDYIRVFQK